MLDSRGSAGLLLNDITALKNPMYLGSRIESRISHPRVSWLSSSTKTHHGIQAGADFQLSSPQGRGIVIFLMAVGGKAAKVISGML